MSLPKLNYQDIEDPVMRKNFQNLGSFTKSQTPLLGFQFFEITFKAATDELKYPHNMGIQPQDIIPVSITGTGGVIFNTDKFDSKNLNLSSTGPCTVRFFAGKYQAGPQA